MLYMIKNNIPGIYYFFIGEERGMVGSGNLSEVFSQQKHLAEVTKCISSNGKTMLLIRICGFFNKRIS